MVEKNCSEHGIELLVSFTIEMTSIVCWQSEKRDRSLD